MPAEDEDLIGLINDALYAATPDDLELALARVIRHPGLSSEERAAFRDVWEDLSDTLLQRWRDLSESRDIVAWQALHRRGCFQVDSSNVPGRATWIAACYSRKLTVRAGGPRLCQPTTVSGTV